MRSLLTVGLISSVFSLMLTGLANAQAPDSDAYIAKMSIEELRNAYNAARLFHQLDAAAQTFDQKQYCGKFLDKADETAQELEQLNQIRNKTTSSYGIRAAEVKEANTKAIADYEKCYDEMLPGFSLIEKEQIFTYTDFGNRYDQMVGAYELIPDLDGYILKLEAALKNSKHCDPLQTSTDSTKVQGAVAVVDKVHRQVEISSSSSGGIKPACIGYQLRVGDTIKTGPRGRIVILAGSNSVRIHIGPNSELKIPEASDPSSPYHVESGSLVELISGTIRVIKGGLLGPRNQFHIRTGTSLVGIRGTEVFVSYDPKSDQADYVLNHGDAFYQLNGGEEVKIYPRSEISIQNGATVSERSVSDSEWAELEASTSIPFGLADDPVAIASTQTDSRQATTSKPTPKIQTSPPANNNSYQSVAQNAASRAKQLLSALRDADVDQVYRVTGGQYHSRLNARQTESGDLASFLRLSKQRPVSFQVGCTVCTENTQDCWTYADISTVGDPSKSQRVVFASSQLGILTSLNWSPDTEKQFHSKGRAYCE